MGLPMKTEVRSSLGSQLQLQKGSTQEDDCGEKATGVGVGGWESGVDRAGVTLRFFPREAGLLKST